MDWARTNPLPTSSRRACTLAATWKQSLYQWLGASIFLCGALGLVLAITGWSTGAIDTAGGVLAGALLLGFGLWYGTRSGMPEVAVPASRYPIRIR